MYITKSDKFEINYYKEKEFKYIDNLNIDSLNKNELKQNKFNKNKFNKNEFNENKFDNNKVYENNIEINLQKYEKMEIDSCIIKKVNEIFKIEPDLKIDIIKRIPMGGGLGGASSNAAFYIKYLIDNKIIKYSLKTNVFIKKNFINKILFDKKLIKIGSDVPFFIKNKPSLVLKNGIHVKKVDFNIPLYFIVLYPDVHFSTKKMYNYFDEKFYNQIDEKKILKKQKKILKKIKKNDFNFLREIDNDFEKVIEILYPDIFNLKKLFKNSLKVLFTGSGSSIVGIYKDINYAKKDFFLLKKKFVSVFFLSWIN